MEAHDTYAHAMSLMLFATILAMSGCRHTVPYFSSRDRPVQVLSAKPSWPGVSEDDRRAIEACLAYVETFHPPVELLNVLVKIDEADVMLSCSVKDGLNDYYQVRFKKVRGEWTISGIATCNP